VPTFRKSQLERSIILNGPKADLRSPRCDAKTTLGLPVTRNRGGHLSKPKRRVRALGGGAGRNRDDTGNFVADITLG